MSAIDLEKGDSANNEHNKSHSDDEASSSGSAPRPLYDDSIESDAVIRRTLSQNSVESFVEQDIVTRILTAGSRKSTKGPLPKMGGGRDYPPQLPNREAYRVDFEGVDDPIHPHNWPIKKKIVTCFVLGYTTFCAAWGSSIFASAVPYVEAQFKVAQVVAVLGVSLYVFGFASGPILWAPISELYGRKLPVIISMLGMSLFTFAVATAKDIQTVMLCRFFAGFFGAAPLAVVAAAFADMFNNAQRGIALTLFSATVFCGPIIAPVIGGFVSESYLGWRWTMYLTGIMAAAAFVGNLFFFEETYHPIILVYKARELRRRTENWGIYASHESVELDINEIITKNLSRPLYLLFTETIIFLVTLYTAFIYGILYLFLEAYPRVFVLGYGMTPGVGELPYLGLAIGMLIASFVLVFFFEPRYDRALKANNNVPVPEARLPPMILGSILFPIGLLWFTWTGNYHNSVHWIVPTISGLFTGFGLMAIFLPAINYIVDSYLFFAASALAANTFMRSGFGGVFPIFANFMFEALGTNWSGLLLGLVGVALIPVPILFLVYGKRIRQKSKYAFDLSSD